MNDRSVEIKPDLQLSQPTVVEGEIYFSAFGPGWGFCSFTLPVGVAMQRLGAKDPSASQLHLAFQLNRQRIIAAVIGVDGQDRGRRAILSTV